MTWSLDPAIYEWLFDAIDQQIPETKVYVQSVLPVNEDWMLYRVQDRIPPVNRFLRQQAEQRDYEFVDIHQLMKTGEVD